MAKEHTSLNLQLNPLSPPGPDSFNLQPKAVKAWLAGLPMANSGEAGRLLYGALREVNSLDVPINQRFEFLEALRRPVRLIVQSLDRHYVGIPFPLPATNRRIADLAKAFHKEMAVGYTLAADKLTQLRGVQALTHRPMLVTAVYRALLYRSRVLVKAFQIYAPYPQLLWREMHELYNFARLEGISKKMVEDPENALVKSRSIEELYKQALLLALSNPYRLRQGDVLKVCNALELWSSYCRLTPVEHPDRQPQGLFAIHLESDEQPTYLDNNSASAGGLTSVLDTTALGGLLREQDAYLNGDQAKPSKSVRKALPPNFPKDLLHRVMLSWGMMVSRGFSRLSTHSDAKVDLALGLSAIFVFTGGDEESLLEPVSDSTELSSNTLVDWAGSAIPRIEHSTHCCQILDESAGGYRLSWCEKNDLRVQVGELLGIRMQADDPNGEEARWTLGVVRWMRAQNKDSMEIGVQMLSPSIKPVTARVCNAEGRCGEHQACLLLPPKEGSSEVETLITPSFFHNFANRLLLMEGGRKRVVSLTRTIENTGAFAQFEFKKEHGLSPAKPEATPEVAEIAEPVQQPAPEIAAKPPPRRRKEESEFESIWNNL